jgi:hypothetical protein
LYGPLAFLAESSARYWANHQAVNKAYEEYFAKFPPAPDRAQHEMEAAIGVANRYGGLIVENNKEGLKILRSGWGWLDADDIDQAGHFMSDVARRLVEMEGGDPLPVAFYFKNTLESGLGFPAVIRNEFTEGIKRKLVEKQRELTGAE